MSRWGEIDAEFHGLGDWTKTTITNEFEDRDPRAPTGSEDGVTARVEDGGVVQVYGRLRDVTDLVDSPMVLAWFCRHAECAKRATLIWELDDGPRYRYVYEDGELRKLKGVLDL